MKYHEMNDIQHALDKRTRKIYFKEDVKITRLADVIANTVNMNNWPEKATNTFFKNRKGELYLQRAGCLRSAQDVYILCKTYKVPVSLGEIYDYMTASNTLTNSYCDTIHRRVFYYRWIDFKYKSPKEISELLNTEIVKILGDGRYVGS